LPHEGRLSDRADRCHHGHKAARGEDTMADQDLPVIANFAVRRRAYIAPDGGVLSELPNFASNQSVVVSMYCAMAMARSFDLKAVSLQRTGRLGTYATSLGQEAVGVGIASAMRPGDVLLPSYRDNAALLLRGVKMEEILLFWGGDERGNCWSGPAHDFPFCIPVGSQAPHAAGVGYAFKYHKEARVAVCILGDGATSKGDVFEAMNFAGVWKLPVVFVVNNNQWAISVPLKWQTASRTLAQKAIAAGFSGEQVDGNDVIAVRAALETIALQVLGEAGRDITAPFGSIFLDAKLLPISRLLTVMRDVSRRPVHRRASRDAAGMLDLRREIAKRYARYGSSVPLDQIIVTAGAIDGVNLALSALLRPGDSVAVEDPCFFPASFSLRRFGLKLVPIPVNPQDGFDLDVLERVFAIGGAKACLMMPSCQNPLGVSLSLEKKARLVRLIERYEVPLIENDAYGEFLPPEEGGSSCKAYDRAGLVIHCSSFSNSLSPELRVGWISAGRFRDRVLSVKFLTRMSSHAITQQTVAEFLRHENFDHHLRNLRSMLGERRRKGLSELDKWGRLITSRSNPKSGYIVWAKLPEGIDSLHLFKIAAAEGLSFVPGALFSVDRLRQNEIALNLSFAWTDETVEALDRLGSLIEDTKIEGSRRRVARHPSRQRVNSVGD